MVKNENGFIPANLEEALKIRAENTVTPYAGGTDLMVEAEAQDYLFLNKVPELKQIREDDTYIRYGAAATFTEIYNFAGTPEILKATIRYLAAPAVRNMGTAGGNICNASPKADSALIFYASDAQLRLCSAHGERIVPIEDFIIGRGKTALQSDELLVEILMPKKGLENYYYEKIGGRKALAISRVAFAGLFNIENGRITRCSAAFGSVANTVLRFRHLESMMVGKTLAEAKGIKKEFLMKYDEAIVPIRGRVSADYRKHVCMNLLEDFLTQNGI